MSSIEEEQVLDNEDVTKLTHGSAEIEALTKKLILELSNEEARSYFLKSESYCKFYLPDSAILGEKNRCPNTLKFI